MMHDVKKFDGDSILMSYLSYSLKDTKDDCNMFR